MMMTMTGTTMMMMISMTEMFKLRGQIQTMLTPISNNDCHYQDDEDDDDDDDCDDDDDDHHYY